MGERIHAVLGAIEKKYGFIPSVNVWERMQQPNQQELQDRRPELLLNHLHPSSFFAFRSVTAL